jgi:hypothetical protein
MRNRIKKLSKIPPLTYSINEKYFGSGNKQEIEKIKKMIEDTENMYPKLLRLYYVYLLFGVLLFVLCIAIRFVLEIILKYDSASTSLFLMIAGSIGTWLMVRKGKENLIKFSEDKDSRINKLNDFIHYINKTGRYSPDYHASTGYSASPKLHKSPEREKCKAGYYETDGDRCFACYHAHSCRVSFKSSSAFIDPFSL